MQKLLAERVRDAVTTGTPVAGGASRAGEVVRRKGLVSDTGEKKKAFFALKDFYRQRLAGQPAR